MFKEISRLDQGLYFISFLHYITLFSFITLITLYNNFFFSSLKDITLSSDPEKLHVVISSGSQKRGGERAYKLGVLVSAANEEPSKNFSGLVKVSIPSFFSIALLYHFSFIFMMAYFFLEGHYV